MDHKKFCLKINYYFKQLAVLFKIYSNFESVLKGVQSNNNDNKAPYTKTYHEHVPCSFTYKVVCIDNKFSKPVVLYRGKMKSISLLKLFLKTMIIVKR